MSTCYHCGDACIGEAIVRNEKAFCCKGCLTVYEILSANDLSYYYELQSGAGSNPEYVKGKYDFLENQEIVSQLLDFDGDGVQVINLSIPGMHCSSCIWVLENLNRLLPSVKSAQVNFPKKTVRITYETQDFSLQQLVELLYKIGYEPSISLKDLEKKPQRTDRKLLYRLGLAGFAFGNVMLLSFPEYFEVEEYWLEQYKPVFRGLMLAFSIPVMLYAARDYFISAVKGLRSKHLNIDVPIALGILTLFLRSAVDVVFDWGPGFFDSLTGLVFFLLVGRYFQQKTYAHLSFERDYRSYFPIGITKLSADGEETNIPIHQVRPGDRILLRNQEIIPIDSILMKGNAQIDYSFVTGESASVPRSVGDKLFAGGKQLGGVLEVEALKSVSQSYLTQLWGNAAFHKNKASEFQTLTDAIGKRFTLGVLAIALLATSFWLWHEPTKALNVFTAVLIIACPCAIALAAPFTLGNLLRIFGQRGFYVKDANTLERLAQIDTVVFDKTGTLTHSSGNTIFYEGMELSDEESSLLKNTLRASNHPLSRELYQILETYSIKTLDDFKEHAGKGIEGRLDGHTVRLGSANYVGTPKKGLAETSVYLSTDSNYKGRFVFKNKYREGVVPLFKRLKNRFSLVILSGDRSGEQKKLEKMFPFSIPMFFDQKPEDKLRFVESIQKHSKVLMVGDGLNDAGALAQSDVGIAVSENVNVFSPACDAILEATKLVQIDTFLKQAKQAIKIIKWSFLLSLCYNMVGLYFAVTGQLQPVIAAILMPLSSISIVVFTTAATNFLGRRTTLKKRSGES